MNSGVVKLHDGSSYPVNSAEFELRPGIAASRGSFRIPVLVDTFSGFDAEVIKKARVGIVTGQRRGGANLPFGTGAEPNDPPPFVAVPQGNGESQAYKKDTSNEFSADVAGHVRASALFSQEFALILTSVELEGDDHKAEKARAVAIERLRTAVIIPVEPIQMNTVVLCQVIFTDRRIDWGKANNFSTSINMFKEIGPDGKIQFWNDSIMNPGGFDNDRRPWGLYDVAAYCLALMGEADFEEESAIARDGKKPLVSGTRHFGYDFNAMTPFFGLGFGGDTEIVQNIEGEGLSPAYILEKLAETYNFTIWFTHQSKPFLVPNNVPPKTPTKKDARHDIVPRFDNVHNIRSRHVVIHGPPLRVQETFYLLEDFGFEYVTPLDGQWRNYREVARMIHPAIEENLPVLATQDFDGDIDKFYQQDDGRPDRIGSIRAASALANTAFKYIRFNPNGRYGRARRPLETLTSLDSSGAMNYPVVLARVAAATKSRVGLASSASEEQRIFENQIAVESVIRMYLVDADSLVFKVNEPLVYPTSEEIDENNQTTRAAIGRLLQIHTMHRWEKNDKLRVLLSSELRGASSRKYMGIDGDHYYYTASSGIDNAQVATVQPPLTIYRDDFAVNIVRAELEYADDGAPQVRIDGSTIVNRTTDNDDNAVVEVGALELARGGIMGGRVKEYIDTVDYRASRIVNQRFETFTADNAVDVEYARVFRPIGSEKPALGDDDYQYNAYLGSIMWTLDDSGCRTMMRFGSQQSFTAMATETDRNFIELMGQRTADHQLAALQAFKRAVERRSTKEQNE